ncbi:MAG: hypothetical protein FJ288_02240 [Planctomycetes bacterium]|nr:hypothetical protein [Planctomycetota bacterium]
MAFPFLCNHSYYHGNNSHDNGADDGDHQRFPGPPTPGTRSAHHTQARGQPKPSLARPGRQAAADAAKVAPVSGTVVTQRVRRVATTAHATDLVGGARHVAACGVPDPESQPLAHSAAAQFGYLVTIYYWLARLDRPDDEDPRLVPHRRGHDGSISVRTVRTVWPIPAAILV